MVVIDFFNNKKNSQTSNTKNFILYATVAYIKTVNPFIKDKTGLAMGFGVLSHQKC